MSFGYRASNNNSGAGVTSLACNVPAGTSVGDLLVAAYALEGVSPGSSPWTIANTGQFPAGNIGPAAGWLQATATAPIATGTGLEVWTAIYGSGVNFTANFAAAQNAVVVVAAYTGEYNPTGHITGAPPRVATSAQVIGNQPAAPAVSANGGELVVACGGDAMTAAKFGTPSGFTNRVDVARAAAGTAEATIADLATTSAGSTGPIVFPNSAASSSTAGVTATLAFVPAPATPSAAIGAVSDASFPPDLDLPDGYVLTWAAIDPTTGADVAGVTVTDVSIFGTLLGASGDGGGGVDLGPFMLVPGPSA